MEIVIQISIVKMIYFLIYQRQYLFSFLRYYIDEVNECIDFKIEIFKGHCDGCVIWNTVVRWFFETNIKWE